MDHKVKGNTSGVRDSVLNGLADLYDLPPRADVFADPELISFISAVSAQINREILVYISRTGQVLEVRIGDDHSVQLNDLRTVRNRNRLSGVRCIHTHPNGSGMLSDVDLGSLSSLKLDAMCAVGLDDSGVPREMYAAFLSRSEAGETEASVYGPFAPDRIPQEMLTDEIRICDRTFSNQDGITDFEPDRAILVGLAGGRYDSLDELESLAKTAGITVVGKESQNRKAADSATYIGSGKASDLVLLSSALEADMIIFDDELSPVQMKNLENLTGLPVMDRTMLILDIFAQRAASREGKLQVELAQLQYRLPRLIGMGRMLSRQGSSGVGMRGPGEKKLEIDRRKIRRRIFELEQDLEKIEKQRSLRREQRSENHIPSVALVGYTNAGKSTLLNRLSDSDVLAEDMLFATLDPVVRRIVLPSGQECLLSDTVGFINKLPHELIEAFKSTLEEVREADLILHVIDASSDYMDVQIETVEDVLSELNAVNIPCIKVYNKSDECGADRVLKNDGIRISALHGDGIERLLDSVDEVLKNRSVQVEIDVPYSKYDIVSAIRESGQILSETHHEGGTRFVVQMEEALLGRIRRLLDSR